MPVDNSDYLDPDAFSSPLREDEVYTITDIIPAEYLIRFIQELGPLTRPEMEKAVTEFSGLFIDQAILDGWKDGEWTMKWNPTEQALALVLTTE